MRGIINKLITSSVRHVSSTLPWHSRGYFTHDQLRVLTINKKQDNLILRRPVEPVQFPLNGIIKSQIAQMKKFAKSRDDLVGISAPQLGFSHRFICIRIDESIKEMEPDADIVPLTLLINPTYSPIGQEKEKDWEMCFSIPDFTGEVWRYKKIKYNAFDETGNIITGEVNSLHARIIQHEVDHLNGILFNDLIKPGDKLGHNDEMIPFIIQDMHKKRENLRFKF